MNSMNPIYQLCKVIHTPNQISFHDETGIKLDELSIKTAYIQLGDLFYKRDVITNYKSKGGTGPFYSLDSICFLLVDSNIRNASYTEYLQKAKKNNIPAISLLDRKDLFNLVMSGSDSLNLLKDSSNSSTNASNIKAIQVWKSLQDAIDNVEYDFPFAGMETEMETSPSLVPFSAFKFKDRESENSSIGGIEKRQSIKSTIKTRVLDTRNTVLKCGQDLGICLEIFDECMKREKEEMEKGKKKREEEKIKETSLKNLSLVEQLTRANVPSFSLNSSSLDSNLDSSLNSSAFPFGSQKKISLMNRDFIPIIIVPASPSAIITIWNVEKFLSEGEFISTMDSKQKAKERQSFIRIEHEIKGENSIKKEKIIMEKNKNQIQNQKEGRMTINESNSDNSKEEKKRKIFEIIDNPTRLGVDEWSRVVGVMVQGVNWQFKGWKWESPLELFQHVCGIYIHYEGEEIPSNILSWNVFRIPISKNKRHLDKTAQLTFWNAIENFLTFENKFV